MQINVPMHSSGGTVLENIEEANYYPNKLAEALAQYMRGMIVGEYVHD
jgi:hypothetical protein